MSPETQFFWHADYRWLFRILPGDLVHVYFRVRHGWFPNGTPARDIREHRQISSGEARQVIEAIEAEREERG